MEFHFTQTNTRVSLELFSWPLILGNTKGSQKHKKESQKSKTAKMYYILATGFL